MPPPKSPPRTMIRSHGSTVGTGGVGKGDGGGGKRVAPRAGASATARVGVDSILKPDGMSAVAAPAEASDGPTLVCTASPAALEEDTIVIARLTEAAVTTSETRLGATPAAEAKLATIEVWTLAV